MDKADNADVKLALAAAGSQSLQYRTFAAADRSDISGTRTSVAAAFPLLAVALPEIADQPVTAAGQTTSAPQMPRVSDDPATGRGDRTSETFAPTAPPVGPMISAPASAADASVAPAAPAADSPSAATASGRSPDTPLAAIFRLLRGQTKPSPTADRDALDKLFRRL